MLKIKKVTFVKSIMNWRDGPRPKLPEVAFVGRSNVGKSSLINTLINMKNLARTSKRPGKTRTLNFFSVNEMFYLVDLPGYGFAKTSKKEQLAWQEAIEGYLLGSEHLRILYVLIDCKVGVKNNDVQLVEWLRFKSVPFQIIATKIDRISKSARAMQAIKIVKMLELADKSDIIFFSAKTRVGKGALWGDISRRVK